MIEVENGQIWERSDGRLFRVVDAAEGDDLITTETVKQVGLHRYEGTCGTYFFNRGDFADMKPVARFRVDLSE